MIKSLRRRVASFAQTMTDEEHIETTETVFVAFVGGILATLATIWVVNEVQHHDRHC